MDQNIENRIEFYKEKIKSRYEYLRTMLFFLIPSVSASVGATTISSFSSNLTLQLWTYTGFMFSLACLIVIISIFKNIENILNDLENLIT